jgi:hypothetical protein
MSEDSDQNNNTSCICCERECDWGVVSMDRYSPVEFVQKAVSISVDGRSDLWLCEDCYAKGLHLNLSPEMALAFSFSWKEFFGNVK